MSNFYPAHDFELLTAIGADFESLCFQRIAVADNVPSVNYERSFTGIVDGRRTAMNHYPSRIQRIPEMLEALESHAAESRRPPDGRGTL